LEPDSIYQGPRLAAKVTSPPDLLFLATLAVASWIQLLENTKEQSNDKQQNPNAK